MLQLAAASGLPVIASPRDITAVVSSCNKGIIVVNRITNGGRWPATTVRYLGMMRKAAKPTRRSAAADQFCSKDKTTLFVS
jgi:hypothetical protein